jgi:hypothetical protein
MELEVTICDFKLAGYGLLRDPGVILRGEREAQPPLDGGLDIYYSVVTALQEK